LVSAACVWLSWFLHIKHNFDPQHHQTPSESFRPKEAKGWQAFRSIPAKPTFHSGDFR
jgi:hypothetical protein